MTSTLLNLWKLCFTDQNVVYLGECEFGNNVYSAVVG